MTAGATVDPAVGVEGANSPQGEDLVGTLAGEHDRVGLFGCPARGGSLVRVGWRGRKDRKTPGTLELDCPVCGQRHHAQPMWRRLNDYDRDRGLDVVIDAADVPTDRRVVADEGGED